MTSQSYPLSDTTPHSFLQHDYSTDSTTIDHYNATLTAPAYSHSQEQHNYTIPDTVTQSAPGRLQEHSLSNPVSHYEPSSSQASHGPFVQLQSSNITTRRSHPFPVAAPSPQAVQISTSTPSPSPLSGRSPPLASPSDEQSASSASTLQLTQRHFLHVQTSSGSDANSSSPNRSPGAVSDSEEISSHHGSEFSSGLLPSRSRISAASVRPASTRHIEQYSRDKLRYAFAEVRNSLPEHIGQARRGRADLLSAAANYITDQENTIRECHNAIYRLRLQVGHLEQALQQQLPPGEEYANSVRSTMIQNSTYVPQPNAYHPYSQHPYHYSATNPRP